MASDEVTDAIAAIEMHRQGTEQESGLAVACSEALGKLQALLAQEKEALQLHGPDTIHAINVEAVANGIKRVQSMAGGKGQGAMTRSARPRGQQLPRPEKSHNPPRNRGRRNIGRSGGRGRSGGGGGSGSSGSGSGGGGAGSGVR
jgi:hypothetical protein